MMQTQTQNNGAFNNWTKEPASANTYRSYTSLSSDFVTRNGGQVGAHNASSQGQTKTSKRTKKKGSKPQPTQQRTATPALPAKPSLIDDAIMDINPFASVSQSAKKKRAKKKGPKIIAPSAEVASKINENTISRLMVLSQSTGTKSTNKRNPGHKSPNRSSHASRSRASENGSKSSDPGRARDGRSDPERARDGSTRGYNATQARQRNYSGDTRKNGSSGAQDRRGQSLKTGSNTAEVRPRPSAPTSRYLDLRANSGSASLAEAIRSGKFDSHDNADYNPMGFLKRAVNDQTISARPSNTLDPYSQTVSARPANPLDPYGQRSSDSYGQDKVKQSSLAEEKRKLEEEIAFHQKRLKAIQEKERIEKKLAARQSERTGRERGERGERDERNDYRREPEVHSSGTASSSYAGYGQTQAIATLPTTVSSYSSSGAESVSYTGQHHQSMGSGGYGSTTQPQSHSYGSSAQIQSHSYGSSAQAQVQSHSYGSSAQAQVQSHSYGSSAQAQVQSHSYGSSAQAQYQPANQQHQSGSYATTNSSTYAVQRAPMNYPTPPTYPPSYPSATYPAPPAPSPLASYPSASNSWSPAATSHPSVGYQHTLSNDNSYRWNQ